MAAWDPINQANAFLFQANVSGVSGLATVTRGIGATLPPFTRAYASVTGGDVNNVITGLVYAYVPPNPSFNAITPARVYDSRLRDGPLANNQIRTISVAKSTGGTNVVPRGASAVLYNLTVANTVATGFLAWWDELARQLVDQLVHSG